MLARHDPEHILDNAVSALAAGSEFRALFDELPVPIYTTTGEYMPHDQCPMAEAIRERRAVRGKVAIAMRPDGSRRAFLPYPTPLIDGNGRLTGAVNLLVDVSEEQAGMLAEQAERCRRLASSTADRTIGDLLGRMAENFDETAAALKEV